MLMLLPCHTVARRVPMEGGSVEGAVGVREGLAVGVGTSADTG